MAYDAKGAADLVKRLNDSAKEIRRYKKMLAARALKIEKAQELKSEGKQHKPIGALESDYYRVLDLLRKKEVSHMGIEEEAQSSWV